MLLAAVAACAGSPQSPSPTTSTSGRSTESATPTATGGPEHPIGVIAVGHSGTTGYMSDPKSPGIDTEANSWATGTKPAVHSIYQRLIEARPETAGHVANASSDGAESDRLPDQATQGLTRMPYPTLLIVQIVPLGCTTRPRSPDLAVAQGRTGPIRPASHRRLSSAVDTVSDRRASVSQDASMSVR